MGCCSSAVPLPVTGVVGASHRCPLESEPAQPALYDLLVGYGYDYGYYCAITFSFMLMCALRFDDVIASNRPGAVEWRQANRTQWLLDDTSTGAGTGAGAGTGELSGWVTWAANTNLTQVGVLTVRVRLGGALWPQFMHLLLPNPFCPTRINAPP